MEEGREKAKIRKRIEEESLDMGDVGLELEELQKMGMPDIGTVTSMTIECTKFFTLFCC